LPRARPETGKRSPDVDEEAFRREFLLVLTRAAAVYASSTSARRAIEETFGVRCAVIHAATGERH
jgi:hypothetical protein